MESRQEESMFVVLPQKLAASHLRQCERQLKENGEDHIGLLYAVLFAHMALHTIVVTVRYNEVGTAVMRSGGKEIYAGGPKSGGTTREFKSLIKDILVDDNDREAIMQLNDIRDRLQHPMPGPAGYIVYDLLSVIETAVNIGIEMWNHPNIKASTDGPARGDAFVASSAILALCATIRSQGRAATS